jgi:hypothetical protein
MRIYVEGIGLVGPGLGGWEASRPLLAEGAAYAFLPTVVAASDLLPPAERRRTGTPVKLALAAGCEAFNHAKRDPAATATVFTSSSGDCDNLHHLCTTLASSEREISPTRFHNSVHNAAAGYWSIATRSREPSTSLSCHDWSFAAGLLDAAAHAVTTGKPMALIAYDHPYPEPMHAVRPINSCFGMSFILTPEPTVRAIAAFEVSLVPGTTAETRMSNDQLEAVRTGVPAARSLPLLAGLACNTESKVILAYGSHNHLCVRVTPCA